MKPSVARKIANLPLARISKASPIRIFKYSPGSFIMIPSAFLMVEIVRSPASRKKGLSIDVATNSRNTVTVFYLAFFVRPKTSIKIALNLSRPILFMRFGLFANTIRTFSRLSLAMMSLFSSVLLS